MIFVLVLRKLPAEIDERQAIASNCRALLAIGVGVAVTTIAAYAMNARNSVRSISSCPRRPTRSATAAMW